jgi:hypothetical protein
LIPKVIKKLQADKVGSAVLLTPTLARTIQVAADGIDHSSEITNYLAHFPPVVFDRMALIPSIHRFQGVGTTTLNA